MAQKVYWKTLILVLRGVQGYIQRNQNNLHITLNTQQYTCLVAVLDAVIECLQVLPVNEPTV